LDIGSTGKVASEHTKIPNKASMKWKGLAPKLRGYYIRFAEPA
jgi:hypothetical protein